MKAWDYLEKILDLPLNTEIIWQTHKHKIMMDGENILAGDIESHLYLQVILFLHWPASLKDILKKQFLDFMKLKRMIQLWLLQICLETLSIYIRLKMGMEKFVA